MAAKMLSRLFISALWSSTGKWVTSCLLFMMFNSVFVTFQCGILGQMWYLIASMPDLCRLSTFKIENWPFWNTVETFDREINIEHKLLL